MRIELLFPPIAFVILLAAAIFLSALCSRLSFRKKDSSDESKKAYSCGEEFTGHMIQPDYSQFFPFAFFFTILHVVAMVVATIPSHTLDNFIIGVLYLFGAIIGLFILLKG